MSLANHGRKAPTFEEAGNVKQPEEQGAEVLVDEEVSTVDEIVSSVVHAPKEKPKKQVSIYLDEDVMKAFEKFGKKYGKGARSNLINNFLRNALNVGE